MRVGGNDLEGGVMAISTQVVIDCADPDRVARFWAEALGYKLQDPPEGFDTWEDFLRDQDVPQSEWNSASAIVDPDGSLPRIYFQRVPESKIVKNRVHLDLNVSGGMKTPLGDRQRAVDAEVERLMSLGATVFRPGEVERGEYWAVLQDPEGNEFCVQ
jgi:catechol 2,3-dioxygenase-like lactoylglutathione lyase family enzyme